MSIPVFCFFIQLPELSSMAVLACAAAEHEAVDIRGVFAAAEADIERDAEE
ncbi:MAG: hypothetical protein IKM36_01255 [Oscillospiraceae bacterium]|nr:hypothetical protein [Oscillospiraceae bacterium]